MIGHVLLAAIAPPKGENMHFRARAYKNNLGSDLGAGSTITWTEEPQKKGFWICVLGTSIKRYKLR